MSMDHDTDDDTSTESVILYDRYLEAAKIPYNIQLLSEAPNQISNNFHCHHFLYDMHTL